MNRMASVTRPTIGKIFQISRQNPFKRIRLNVNPTIRIASSRYFSKYANNQADNANSKTNSTADQASLQAFLKQNENITSNDYLTPSSPITVQDLPSEERADYETLSKPDQERYIALQNHYKAAFETAADDKELDQLADQVSREIDREEEDFDFNMTRAKGPEIGFWAEDEDDELGQMEDADDETHEEDITTVAESELELHREIREYTRVVAWDMPLLQKFAKPFQVPSHETPLRFRYTTYLGEHHPATKKVVVEFCTKDLPDLTEQERNKLIKLSGVRYNPDTDVVKMSCEKFETAAQNKRYLGDTVQKLVAAAKDHSEMFEDIPLDLRHHKSKTKTLYPEEWKLRPDKVKELMAQRNGGQLYLPESSLASGDREMEYQYIRNSPGQPKSTQPDLS